MAVVHAVAAVARPHVAPMLDAVDDPEASGEALRHVLVGGVHRWRTSRPRSPRPRAASRLPPHKATKIIGEVLAEID